MTGLGRTVLITVGVVVALAVVGIGILVWQGRTPEPGDFYTPPASVPAAPGTVIRSEPYTRGVPEGARAWRILYASTDPEGTPIAVSALVVSGTGSRSSPRPVLAWAHGTTGVVPGCAPSLTDQAITTSRTSRGCSPAAGWWWPPTIRGWGRPVLTPTSWGRARRVQSALLPKDCVAIDIATDPRWSRPIAQNTPSQTIAAPLFVAQGLKDIVVSPAVTRAHVRERCARGEAVEFREYPASGHVDVIDAAGDAALAWTQERFAGRPAPTSCVG